MLVDMFFIRIVSLKPLNIPTTAASKIVSYVYECIFDSIANFLYIGIRQQKLLFTCKQFFGKFWQRLLKCLISPKQNLLEGCGFRRRIMEKMSYQCQLFHSVKVVCFDWELWSKSVKSNVIHQLETSNTSKSNNFCFLNRSPILFSFYRMQN